MNIPNLHAWPKDYRSATELQRSLSERISLTAIEDKDYSLVAGADVSGVFARGRLWAAVVVLKLPGFEVIEESYATVNVEFPYIPGLLSFRELPVMLEAMRKLNSVPDVVICDGQGLAHPRFFGLACHLGLWLNLPTVGCAKSRLVGEASEPGPNPGNWRSLRYKDRNVGAVLRTRNKSKPVFVSPGHLMDIRTARRIVRSCCQRARLPEPTRLAHLAVNRYRLNDQGVD
ncbi:MAG TPA: endonuclease V [Bacteroidetes bacterium]|nr:endonuclease V [Bacteroidota bacterium]